MSLVKIACVQTDVRFAEPDLNADSALAEIERLAGEGVRLAIFPEAYLTGYVVRNEAGARAIAIHARHHALERFRSAAERYDMIIVVGYAERTEGGALRNAAVLFEAASEPRVYHKTHLPSMGFDKFARPGASLPVFATSIGRIGILVCLDLRVPEAARALVLHKAELIVLPTNWPEGAELSADVLTVARAAENRVFLAACNRVGEEHGFKFIGRSKIVNPEGKVIAQAGDQAETLTAEIDLTEARVKHVVVRAGEYEWNAIDSRRPELYGPLREL